MASKAAEARRGSRREGQEASPLPRRVSLDSLPTLAEVQHQRRTNEKPTPRVLDRIADKRKRELNAAAFRQAVWTRDGGLCRLSGRKVTRSVDSTVRGHVHHLRGRNVAPEDKYNPKAAILVCAICHAKIHSGEVTAR